MGSEPPFERTECACRGCVQCCRDQPASLVPGDFERIAAHLGLDAEAAKPLFVASPGARVLTAGGNVVSVGTITPARGPDGACVFLDARGECRVHAVAPAGCAYFDLHMDRWEGHRRAVWCVKQQVSDEYQALRDTLQPAAAWRPRTW